MVFNPDPFLGSGPEGVDDLCFHTGEFSAYTPPRDPNPSFKAQISALRLKSHPHGSNPSLEAKIPSSKPKSHPLGSNPTLEAGI